MCKISYHLVRRRPATEHYHGHGLQPPPPPHQRLPSFHKQVVTCIMLHRIPWISFLYQQLLALRRSPESLPALRRALLIRFHSPWSSTNAMISLLYLDRTRTTKMDEKEINSLYGGVSYQTGGSSAYIWAWRGRNDHLPLLILKMPQLLEKKWKLVWITTVIVHVD